MATVAQRAGAAVREIEDMTYELSLSTLQAEMIALFAHEIVEAGEIEHGSDVSMVRLADALERGSERTFAALTTVSSHLTSVLDHVSEVSTGIDRLSRLALNGRIELASVPDAGSIGTLFSDVERQVEDARTRLTSFQAVAAAAKDLEQAARHPAMNAPAELRAGAESLGGRRRRLTRSLRASDRTMRAAPSAGVSPDPLTRSSGAAVARTGRRDL